jgi:hypothetical protein
MCAYGVRERVRVPPCRHYAMGHAAVSQVMQVNVRPVITVKVSNGGSAATNRRRALQHQRPVGGRGPSQFTTLGLKLAVPTSAQQVSLSKKFKSIELTTCRHVAKYEVRAYAGPTPTTIPSGALVLLLV